MRQCATPIGAVWLVAVGAVWLAATAALAGVLWRVSPGENAGALIADAMRSSAVASILIGGPATAVALRVRRTAGPSRAVLSGLAVAALVTGFLCGYLAQAGIPLAGAWPALGPVGTVALAEMGLAFALRGRRAVLPGLPGSRQE